MISRSSATQTMRGLTQYIADLRACRTRELEEKAVNREMAHIRQKFRAASALDGYQRKKYVAKIIFTYMQGYSVDVGHLEAVNLVASTRYSEKQIGYLALTLLMHENSDLVRLVINSLRKDLESYNEVHICLALHAVANVGSLEMAEALSEDVLKLLVSPTSPPTVQKKAALTLLRLYRKFPEGIAITEWNDRLSELLASRHLGVALSVASLLITLAQDDPASYALCYPHAVETLHKVIVEREYTEDYLYHDIPSPWLLVKLLRLLQYFEKPAEPRLGTTLNAVFEQILREARLASARSVQQSSAYNAILFEAIRLAIHIDTGSAIAARFAVLLGKFLVSRETNVRYLGLDTMARLALRVASLESIKMHEATIIQALRDPDVSVRRRALDLLYSMCDEENVKRIVAELLRCMGAADPALREQMIVKTAILTDRFALDYRWYIDTTFSLLTVAGDHVGDEVWCRTVQVVANTADAQPYAARQVLARLEQSPCQEMLVKLAAYILGEWGYLIADQPGASPLEQFHILHTRSHLSTWHTRALLLNTYVKWINVFPELREQLLYVLRRYQHVLDTELQQRACEYVALAEIPSETLLRDVCEEMPPYSQHTMQLLPHFATPDAPPLNRRTAGARSRVRPVPSTVHPLAAASLEDPALLDSMPTALPDAEPPDVVTAADTSTLGDKSVDLLDLRSFDLEDNKESSVEPPALDGLGIRRGSSLDEGAAPLGPVMPRIAGGLSPDTAGGIGAGERTTSQSPLLGHPATGPQLQPVSMRPDEFFQRWKMIGPGEPREVQDVFPILLTADGSLDRGRYRSVVQATGFCILEQIDPRPDTVVGTGVMNTDDGKVGCMLRLEPNEHVRLCRLTVRTTSGALSRELLHHLVARLAGPTEAGPPLPADLQVVGAGAARSAGTDLHP